MYSNIRIMVIMPFVIFKPSTSLSIRDCTSNFSPVKEKCMQKRVRVCTAAIAVLISVYIKPPESQIVNWGINMRTDTTVVPSHFVKFCQDCWKERPHFSKLSK